MLSQAPVSMRPLPRSRPERHPQARFLDGGQPFRRVGAGANHLVLILETKGSHLLGLRRSSPYPIGSPRSWCIEDRSNRIRWESWRRATCLFLGSPRSLHVPEHTLEGEGP